MIPTSITSKSYPVRFHTPRFVRALDARFIEYATFGKLSGETAAQPAEVAASASDTVPGALSLDVMRTSLTNYATYAVASTSDDGGFRPTRRVRTAPGGETHDIFAHYTDDDALANAPSRQSEEQLAQAQQEDSAAAQTRCVFPFIQCLEKTDSVTVGSNPAPSGTKAPRLKLILDPPGGERCCWCLYAPLPNHQTAVFVRCLEVATASRRYAAELLHVILM